MTSKLDSMIKLLYKRVTMVVILARIPKEKENPPHDPYAWYARALKEGYGIVAPIPANDQDGFDRLMGLFVNFLGKRMERDTFFVAHTTKTTSASDRAHAREVLALFPKDTMLVEGNKSENCTWLEVNSVDTKERFSELETKIMEARGKKKKVAVVYDARQFETEEQYKDAILKIISLNPEFLVSDRPKMAREVIEFIRAEPWMRIFRRWKPIYFLRNRIGRMRFKLRTLPRYWVVYLCEALLGQLVSIHLRPLYARDYTAERDPLNVYPRCTIVLQGPIQHKRSFTLETIRMYRKMFPEVSIVLSTWEDENKKILNEAREAGADVVVSKKPTYGGPGNTNMQLTSSLAGVTRAKEMGAEYIVKQRTDLRMYNARAIETMVNFLKYFPPSKRSNQKARILFGTGSTAYQPYQYGEFLFGTADDIVDYYSAPLIQKGQEYEHYLVEMYLPTEFLKKKGWKLEWTIAHGWDVHRECFITLDWSALDMYWYKYYNLRYWEYQNQRQYTKSVPSRDLVAFDEWFNILVDMENKTLRPDQKLIFKLVSRAEEL